jgi:hypothetical protein
MDADLRRLEFPAHCNGNTLAIYAYWLNKCGERRMPASRVTQLPVWNFIAHDVPAPGNAAEDGTIPL